MGTFFVGALSVSNRMQWIFSVVLCAGLSSVGCQSTPTAPLVVLQSATPTFEHLWKTYRHCVSSSNPEAAREHAALLHQAAYRDEDMHTFLPTVLDQYVEKAPSRLAADPRVLAAACRDHADRIEQVRYTQ